MIRDDDVQNLYKLPDSLPKDLEHLRELATQFKQGEIDAARFQAFRVPQGVYEQRESGTFMLRVRLPAGMLAPHQMRRLAEVAETYGNGVLHLTTRQDIQVHRVRVEAIHPALVALSQAGLSTKGGGGNTVRNITACCDAGVCSKEAFDVTPHAVALTEAMLNDPLSFQLPRKYKIAFSGCGDDCPGATVNDLGLIAKRRNGTDGFAVYAAGGMGNQSRTARLLEAFVPASQVGPIAEAVKRVFDKHGNRKNKNRARLRFLVEKIGFEAFRELYAKELHETAAVSSAWPTPRPAPQVEPGSADGPSRPASGESEEYQRWRRTNVTPQKQDGFHMVEIPVFLGDIDAKKLPPLADIVQGHGERMVRSTQQQNLVIRWVRAEALGPLHEQLSALGLAGSQAPILRHMAACAGASTCRLGICLSRGLARAVCERLVGGELDLQGPLGEVSVFISGCPNGCGRHPIAQIGLVGAARRVRGRLVPYYLLQLGGRVEEGRTRLAAGGYAVPARNVPAWITEFLAAYRASPQFPDFYAFLEAEGRKVAEDLAEAHKEVPDFRADKNAYYDWGAEEVFSLAGRGPGECSAGVFNLIEVDLASAADALNEARPFAAATLACRALLVTRGEQPVGDAAETFALFEKHFVQQRLVDARLGSVVAHAAAAAATPDPEAAFGEAHSGPEGVSALVASVRELYQNMDASLRFSVRRPEPPPAQAEVSADSNVAVGVDVDVDVSKDFRGVACPLNYVKVKLSLEPMSAGQVLAVLLDEQGAKNVPGSAARDGHEVVSVTARNDHWQILLRKGG